MSYRIAVASSDGISIDLHFGEADHFLIYEVEGMEYTLMGERRCRDEKRNEETGPARANGEADVAAAVAAVTERLMKKEYRRCPTADVSYAGR